MAKIMRVRVLRVAPSARFAIGDDAQIVGVESDADPQGRSLLVYIGEVAPVEDQQTGEAAVTEEVPGV